MKRIICYLYIVFLVINLKAQIGGQIMINDSEINFTQKSEYDIMVWNKSENFIHQNGAPQLPVLVESFVVPLNAKVTGVSISNIQKRRIEGNYFLYPVQPPVPVGEVNDIQFIEPDSVIYKSSSPFPSIKAEIISDGYEHGYHIVTIQFYPFEYLPRQKEIYSCNFTYTISYAEGMENYEYPVKVTSQRAERSRIYIESIVKNVADVSKFSNKISPVVQTESTDLNRYFDKNTSNIARNISVMEELIPEYIIITNEELKPAFEELRLWKTRKGIPTYIETIENIKANFGGVDLAEKIRNYLKECRKRWGDGFFVLLGGDSDVIPARIGANGHPQDLYYTALDGDWNRNKNHLYNEKSDSADYQPDIYVGRICVNKSNQVNTITKKIITYEKANANIDYSYINNSMATFGFFMDYMGLLQSDYRRNLELRYNNAPQLNKWLMFSHFNCECSKHDPPYITTSGGEEYNRINFLSALQDGGNSGLNHFHIVYHFDHSERSNLGASFTDKMEYINNEDVDKFKNGEYYQIVMSGGCHPATFTFDCVAEHFLNNPNGGAVAFIGNADVGNYGDDWQFGKFLSSLFSEKSRKYDLGFAFQSAMDVTSDKRCRLHLLGDPTMQVWTAVPKNLSVSIMPQNIVSGENQVTVKVNNLPSGQKAMICLMKDEEGYATMMVNGTQPHTFTFTPRTSGNLNITVTAHNFRPYETTIPVRANDNPAIYISDLVFDDDKVGNSNGNGDGQLDAGEKIELTVILKNSGKIAFSGIQGILSCNSPEYIHLLNNEVNFGSAPAGGTVQCSIPFIFQIDKNTPEIRRNALNGIKFSLKLKNGQNSFYCTDTFKVDVFAPDLQMGQQAVSSTMIPEISALKLMLFNKGKAEATGLTAILEPDGNDSYVSSCSASSVSFPNIAKYSTSHNSTAFQFQLKNSYQEGQPMKMKLTVTNEYGRQWILPLDPNDVCGKIDATKAKYESGYGTIKLHWENIPKAAGYEVYRSKYPNNFGYEKLTTFPVNSSCFIDESVPSMATFYYKIRTVSPTGNVSDFSDPIRGVPSLPLIGNFPALPQKSAINGQISVADINNDGYKEIIYAGTFREENNYGVLSIVNYEGKDILHKEENNYNSLATFPEGMRALPAIGNLYGTGEQFIVGATWRDGSNRNLSACFSGYDNNEDGQIDKRWQHGIPSCFRGFTLSNVDSSSDGLMEVVLKSHRLNNVQIWNSNGAMRCSMKAISSYSYAAVADLDGDGSMEIIVSNDTTRIGSTIYDGGLSIYHYDGSPLSANPIYGARLSLSSPVVCDLNKDGRKDIVVAEQKKKDVRIYAISPQGIPLPGWNGTQMIPYTAVPNDGLDKMISVGDINGDGYLEVVTLGVGRIRAWNYRGNICLDKVVSGLSPNIEVPILADVDGDSRADIIYYINDKIYAIDGVTGNLIPRFPLQANYALAGNPCVSDIDYDGKNELMALDVDGHLYAWKTLGKSEGIEWGSERHDIQNTGEYAPICESMVITSNKTWNGETPCGNVIVRSGQLTIPSGQTLTLDPTALLAVRPGATLIVDGGTILNARIHALPGSTVILRNNGTIRLNSRGTFTLDEGAVLNQEYGTITP